MQIKCHVYSSHNSGTEPDYLTSHYNHQLPYAVFLNIHGKPKTKMRAKYKQELGE